MWIAILDKIANASRVLIYAFWNRAPSSIKETLRSSTFFRRMSLVFLSKVHTFSSFRLEFNGEVRYPLVQSIDIVVTSYRQSQYLTSALLSIFEQSFQPTRIVVVNHCSDLEELIRVQEIVNRFPQLKIELLNVEECWPGTARNHGSAKSSSDAILFLDGDDYLHSEYLTNSLFWMNYLDCDFIGAWCQIFTENDGRIEYGDIWKVIKAPTWENLVTSNAFPVSSLIRRQSLDAIGGWKDFDSENVRQDEAINLWRRFIIKGFYGFNLQQTFIYLRRHSMNLSSKPSEIALFREAEMQNSWNTLLSIEESENTPFSTNRFVCNPEIIQKLKTFYPSQDKESILLLIPDATFFGAGRVISWTVSQLSRDNNLIIVNCDIQGLGGTLKDHLESSQRNGIIELGAILDSNDWGKFLIDLIKGLEVTKVYSYGHSFVNFVLFRISKELATTNFSNWIFNTMSANAEWLKANPNSYSKIFAESQKSIQFLVQAGWESKRLVKVPHLAHRIVSDFPVNDNKEMNSQEIRVIWFSRMASEKMPQIYVRAVSHFKDNYHFRFFMGGSGPLRTKIVSKSKDLQNFSFLDEGIDPRAAMSDMDIFISTSSLVEGRPLAVIEALEMGLEVFVPDSGSLSELLTDGYLGIHIYYTFRELVDLLTEFAESDRTFKKENNSFHNRMVSEQRIQGFVFE
jgi:glycosyltransferase involved in cell wall biosynthesis